MKDRKKIFEAVFFITVTVLALSVLFRGQNWSDLLLLIRKSNPVCLLSAVFLGLLFVCLEGYMIWRLLRLSGNDATLPGCIRYSFIGYFYSGITPSATGGQPAQLYEMCKDGNNASDSTVVLMVVALFYKLVLVVIGLMLPVVWLGHMREYLGSWLGLYVVGIVLNVVLVALLCGVMFSPGLILNIMCGVLAAGERCGIVKNGEKLRQDAAAFAGRYRETTHFLREHKGELVVIGAVTFLQRSTVFLITGMVYPWLRTFGEQSFSHSGSAGGGVHCGGHASGSGCAGNHGAYVCGGVRRSVWRTVCEGVHGAGARHGFLCAVLRQHAHRACWARRFICEKTKETCITSGVKLCVLFRRDADCFCEGTQIIAVVVEAAGFAGFRDGTALIKQ